MVLFSKQELPGSALAVAKLLKKEMLESGIKASMALGGITGYMVDLLEEGLVEGYYGYSMFSFERSRVYKQKSKTF